MPYDLMIELKLARHKQTVNLFNMKTSDNIKTSDTKFYKNVF